VSSTLHVKLSQPTASVTEVRHGYRYDRF